MQTSSKEAAASAQQPLLHATPPSSPAPTTTTAASLPPSLRLQYCTSLLALLTVGTAYSFSSWAPDLKARLSYTQSDIETLGYMGNLGLLLPFAGILVSRYPPHLALVPGALLILLGNLGLAAGVSGSSSIPAWISSPAAMAFANATVIIGVTCVYIVVISINAGNLPKERIGVGLSVLVMGYGLSASLFSLLYVYVVRQDLFAYFITAGLLASSVCFLNAFTLKKMPRPPSDDAVPRAPFADVDEARAVALADGSLLSAFRVLGHVGRTQQFWVYIGFMLCTAGTGYAVINNSGSVVQSLNGGVIDSAFTFSCILVLSVGNALGRLSVGLSDGAAFRRGWFGVACAVLMCAVYAWNAFVVSGKGHWLLTAFCTGLSFGCCWAIVPIQVAETWPAAIFPITCQRRSHSALLLPMHRCVALSWCGCAAVLCAGGWIAATPPVASLVFNAYIGVLYDRQADASHNCIGRKCWVDGFGAGMTVTTVGIIISLYMLRFTRVGKEGSVTETPGKGEKAALEDGSLGNVELSR